MSLQAGREPERIDIAPELEALLEQLGYHPSDVSEVTITPTEARVIGFRRNENGSKFVEKTGTPVGDPAVFVHEHHVRT